MNGDLRDVKVLLFNGWGTVTGLAQPDRPRCPADSGVARRLR